jgi:hypothetical protein
MNNSETLFSRKLTKKLEASGAIVFNVHGHAMQKSGFPDLLIFHPIWTGGLELKIGSVKLPLLQQVIIDKLIRVGFSCFVVRYYKDEDEIRFSVGKMVYFTARFSKVTGFQLLEKLNTYI